MEDFSSQRLKCFPPWNRNPLGSERRPEQATPGWINEKMTAAAARWSVGPRWARLNRVLAISDPGVEQIEHPRCPISADSWRSELVRNNQRRRSGRTSLLPHVEEVERSEWKPPPALSRFHLASTCSSSSRAAFSTLSAKKFHIYYKKKQPHYEGWISSKWILPGQTTVGVVIGVKVFTLLTQQEETQRSTFDLQRRRLPADADLTGAEFHL